MSNKRQGTLISDEKLRASVGCPFQTERRVVVEEQTIDGFYQEGDSYSAPTSLRPDLGDYETIVVWDGVEYETEIITESLPDSIIAYVGNQKIIYGVDTGEPFTLFAFDDGPMIVHAVDGSTATSHTFSIIQKVPRKLGKEYLPDDVGGGGFIILMEGHSRPDNYGTENIYTPDNVYYADGTKLTSATRSKLLDAVTEGTPIMIHRYNQPEVRIGTILGVSYEEVADGDYRLIIKGIVFDIAYAGTGMYQFWEWIS